MTGKLYGIGVGPGDPELLTLKAIRRIKESDVIAFPGTSKETCTAYDIVKQAIPDIDKKQVLAISMPMTKDSAQLAKSHQEGAKEIADLLHKNCTVAFLTLGDPTVYSTYLYIHSKMIAAGFNAEIVSGITSFCAVSARLNMGLVEKSQMLHVIPASYQIEDALTLKGTKVLMKAGKKISAVKELLKRQQVEALMIENCGMTNEKIYWSVDEIPENAGYYSLIIVKEKE